jgi:hypothetical protein
LALWEQIGRPGRAQGENTPEREEEREKGQRRRLKLWRALSKYGEADNELLKTWMRHDCDDVRAAAALGLPVGAFRQLLRDLLQRLASDNEIREIAQDP